MRSRQLLASIPSLRLLLTLGICVALLLAVTPGSADAEDEEVVGTVDTTDSGGWVQLTATGGSGGTPGVVYVDPCNYIVGPWSSLRGMINAALGIAIPVGTPPEYNADGSVHETHEYSWVIMQCPQEDGSYQIFGSTVYQLGETTPGLEQDLLEAARRALNAPLPDVQFSPPGATAKVVGIDTWMWLEGPQQTDPRAVEVCILQSACAQLSAELDTLQLEIETGDPDGPNVVVDCPDGGIAYNTGLTDRQQRSVDNCGWVWIYDGTFNVTSTTYWDLAWTCMYDASRPQDGVRETPCAPVGPLGQVDREAPPVPVLVEEWQAEGSR